MSEGVREGAAVNGEEGRGIKLVSGIEGDARAVSRENGCHRFCSLQSVYGACGVRVVMELGVLRGRVGRQARNVVPGSVLVRF